MADRRLDAADRLAARRTLGSAPAAAPVLADRVPLRPRDEGQPLTLEQLHAGLTVLGITDPSSVAAVQIDTDLQVLIWRRRHAGRPDGGHLVHETHPIQQEAPHG